MTQLSTPLLFTAAVVYGYVQTKHEIKCRAIADRSRPAAAACQRPIQALGFARVHSGTKRERILCGPGERKKRIRGCQEEMPKYYFHLSHSWNSRGGKDCFSLFRLSAFNRFGRRKTHSSLLTNHLVHRMRRPEGFLRILSVCLPRPFQLEGSKKKKPEG